MPRFSIKFLLIVAAFFGLLVALVAANFEARKTKSKLTEADRKVKTYEDELGIITVVDPKKSYARRVGGPIRFGGDKFNVRLADGSRAQVYYYGGNLPEKGVPNKKVELSSPKSRPSPKGPVDVVIYVDHHQLKHPGTGANFSFILHSLNQKFDTGRCDFSPPWDPWTNPRDSDFSPACVQNDVTNEQVEFDLDHGPQVILKHFDAGPNSTLTGYMVWIENEKDDGEKTSLPK